MRKYLSLDDYKGISGDLRASILTNIGNLFICICIVFIGMRSLEPWGNEYIIQFNFSGVLLILLSISLNIGDRPIFSRKSKMSEVLPITDRDYFIVNFIGVLIKIITIILCIGLLFLFKSGDEMPGLRGVVILYSIFVVYLITKRNILESLGKDSKRIKVLNRLLLILLFVLNIIILIDIGVPQVDIINVRANEIMQKVSSMAIPKFFGSRGAAAIVVMGVILSSVYYNYTYVINEKKGKNYFNHYFLGAMSGELKRGKGFFIIYFLLFCFFFFLGWGSNVDKLITPSNHPIKINIYSGFLLMLIFILTLILLIYNSSVESDFQGGKFREVLPISQEDIRIGIFVLQCLYLSIFSSVILIIYLYPSNHPLVAGGRGMYVSFIVLTLIINTVLMTRKIKISERAISVVCRGIVIFWIISDVMEIDGIFHIIDLISYNLISMKVFKFLGGYSVGAILIPIVLILFCYINYIYIIRKNRI